MSLWILSNCSAGLLKQNDTNKTASNAPSEIAQLRKSSDQIPTDAANTGQVDHPEKTNSDDYIFSDNISTPTEMSVLHSPEPKKKEAAKSANFIVSGIAIKMRESSTDLFPQVPTVNKVDPETDPYPLDQPHPPETIQYNFAEIPLRSDTF
jgi:GATA-binding protein